MHGGYDTQHLRHPEFGRSIRESVGEKIRVALNSGIDGITSLFPKKEKFDRSNKASSDRIPRRDHISPQLIAKRILMTGAALAGLGVAWLERQTIIDAVNNLPQISARAFDTEIGAENSDTYEENIWGVVIKYDREGLPLSYKVNEQETLIDREKLNLLQEKAKKEGMPQLVFYAKGPVNESEMPTIFSEDRPEVTKLPEDVLTTEELAERGITIIQGEEVKLHLRESAFWPGSSLDTFQVGAGNKMTIVLVDGPSVSAAYMKDPKYDKVRKIVGGMDVDIEKFRQEKIEEEDRNAAMSAKLLKDESKKSGSVWLPGFRKNYIEAVIKRDELEKAPVEILASDAGMTEAAGLYDPDSRTVFVSVGKSADKGSPTRIYVYVDEKGEVHCDHFIVEDKSFDYVPKLSQSHPRRDDFTYYSEQGEAAPTEFPGRLSPEMEEKYTDNPEHYPYMGQKPSQILGHELKHYVNITAYPTGNSTLDRSEYRTDMETMGDIDRAFIEFEESGYKNDSLYWIIFEKDGKYIIGKNIEEAKSSL